MNKCLNRRRERRHRPSVGVEEDVGLSPKKEPRSEKVHGSEVCATMRKDKERKQGEGRKEDVRENNIKE